VDRRRAAMRRGGWRGEAAAACACVGWRERERASLPGEGCLLGLTYMGLRFQPICVDGSRFGPTNSDGPELLAYKNRRNKFTLTPFGSGCI
jgi:hypothetical protein